MRAMLTFTRHTDRAEFALGSPRDGGWQAGVGSIMVFLSSLFMIYDFSVMQTSWG